MNELIQKLAQQIEAINASQETALKAAQADGVSDDDKAKHLAEFDRLAGEKTTLKANLKRAQDLAVDQLAMRQPAAPVILRDPGRTTLADPTKIPAEALRHANPINAFKNHGGAEAAYRCGVWAAASLFGHEPSTARCAELGIPLVRNAGGPQSAFMSSANNRSAGFLVPEEFTYAILELSQQYGVFRREAEVVPMSTETKTSPRWAGVMTAYWIGIGAKPTQSDPAFDLITLVTKEMGAMTKMSRQLDEDSAVDLGEKVAQYLAIAFAYAEDNAGFNGDGTNTYGGITGIIPKLGITSPVSNAASIVAAASGHSGYSTVTRADYEKVIGTYPEYPNSKPKWYCSKFWWANSMQELQLAAGGNTAANIGAGGVKEFLGYEVVISQVLLGSAAAATNIPVIFGDLKLGVKLGQRRMLSVESGFENDDFTKQLITILGTQRVDINVHTLTDPKDSAQPGPILGLQLTA